MIYNNNSLSIECRSLIEKVLSSRLCMFLFCIIRWTKQNIVLENPTDETLELVPVVSNTNNFSLERDSDRPLLLRPQASLEVPIHFMPSTLGEGDHLTKICFNSEQVGQVLQK